MERKNRMANKCKIKMEKVNGGRQAFTTLRTLIRTRGHLALTVTLVAYDPYTNLSRGLIHVYAFN